jgi:hypothetical protein
MKNPSNSHNYLKQYKIQFWVLGLGIIHQFTQKILHLNINYIDSYFDDLLAVPFISSLILLIENTFVYKNAYRKHSFTSLLIIFISTSILFEYLLPKIDVRIVSDGYDILLYFIGFIGYYWIQKKPQKRL